MYESSILHRDQIVNRRFHTTNDFSRWLETNPYDEWTVVAAADSQRTFSILLAYTLEIKKDDADSAKKKGDRTTEAAEGIDHPTATRAKFRFDNEQG